MTDNATQHENLEFIMIYYLQGCHSLLEIA